MAEREVEARFEVEVIAYGDEEKMREKWMISLAQAIHFGAFRNFRIRTRKPIGPWRRFDPKGHDMGNHGAEHPEPLVEDGGEEHYSVDVDKLMATTDTRVWAEEFCRRFEGDEIDSEVMMGWFANAMAVGETDLGQANWLWNEDLQMHIPCCAVPVPGSIFCGNGPLTGLQIHFGNCGEH